jgi:hypothetical protein
MRRARGTAAAALGVLVLAGCGADPPATAPRLPRASVPPWSGTARGGEPSRRVTSSPGWTVTVYYTAVEQYHQRDPEQVTGCLRLDCTQADDDLGTYPADFVAAVRTEGTGRTASGRYLNWSYDVGFWLDTAPRDTDGDPLEPYVSAAADPDVLPHGTRFTFADCGRRDDGSPTPAAVCEAFRAAHWRVDDEFTPGLGGRKHVDAYIGPETGPEFTSSDAYVSLQGVTLRLG